MSPDVVRRFAELVAEPGTPASYIDQENKKTGSDSLEAASRSRRAYFVVVRDTILAIDCDCDQLVPVLDEIKARLIGEGFVPVVLLSGGAGRRHLFCLILDPETRLSCSFSFRSSSAPTLRALAGWPPWVFTDTREPSGV